ncbi:MAG TPA: response regulator [Fibrobacteria bacterium]|nr:response regulator [Fibrobacteria bacterium]
MKPRALIVDDSITVRMDLKDSLEEAGFAASLCATAAAARDALSRNAFDLIILDVLLPDADGMGLLREIKSNPAWNAAPVMLLSSEDDVRDRIRGLKTGADEYLGKPYDRAQVVSRARALLRRGKPEVRGKPLVLMIDDSATFREAMREVLEKAGYDVAQAVSGEEGLGRTADLRPDALIVDGVLPGMEGVEVIRSIRSDAALRRTPCLLLTATLERKDELRALEAGADLFAYKDEDKDVILAKLTVLLRPGRAPVQDNAASLLGPKRVLAVDDSFTYLGELSEKLRQDGYDVVSARSGEEALDLLAYQKVDAILLDVVMPGLSGEEVCRRIKSNPAWRDTPLIMLTSLEDRGALLNGINAGADDYITKSSRFEVLQARLNAQLRRRQFEDENRRFREDLMRREMEALEVQAVRELAETRAAHIGDLERKNQELREAKDAADSLARELESFSYSVSHDLRAPLRGIDGFSRILKERHAGMLDEKGRQILDRVLSSAQRMGELIDDMLSLARVTRKEIAFREVDLSGLAREIVAELRRRDPDRAVEAAIQDGLSCRGDASLMRILLENLIGNAWKFTSRTPDARIWFSSEREPGGGTVFCVRDNGAGFNMAYSQKLFGVFQRLHSEDEFSGTGVGLATVQRVIQRHGGKVWAEGEENAGARFFFRL